MRKHIRALTWVAVTAAATGAVSGCASDLDTSRNTVDEGSFGQTLVTLVCKRIAYIEDLGDDDGRVDVSGDRFRDVCRGLEAPPGDAPDEIQALAVHRDRLVQAIDTMWPASMLDDVQSFATSEQFLAAYDDGTIEAGMIALRDMLRLVADDTEMLQVIEALALREGYTPGASGALASILSSPDLRDVLLYTSDDIAPGGSAHEALTLLASATAFELQKLEVPADPKDPERTARLLLGLLLTKHSSLTTQTPLLLVARDYRGIAEIAPLTPGVLPPPFVDMDGDGLADVDELGQFVDATGAIIDAPSPLPTADPDPEGTVRDELGRAIETSVSQLPLYRYHYPDDTLLVALARDARALLDPEQGTGIDLVRGAGALMGPRAPATREYEGGVLEYNGFDTTQAPILDALHAGLQVLRDPNTGDLLALARTLLDQHEPTAAELAEALLNALDVPGDLGELGDRAQLEADSRLLDDLVPVLQKILDEPGLLEELLTVLHDPKVVQLGGYFRDYMRYSDKLGYRLATPTPTPNPDSPPDFLYDIVNLDTGLPATGFVTEVDRNASDTGDNRSIFQRVLHLLADTNRMRLCNKPGAQLIIDYQGLHIETPVYETECELLQIENLAVFYVQSLAYVRRANGDFVTELAQVEPPPSQPPVPQRVCDNCPNANGICPDADFVRKSRLAFDWQNDLIEAAFVDESLEVASGIEGLTNCPTPQALNKLLFLDPVSPMVEDLFGRVTNDLGVDIANAHAGSVTAWELGEFYDLVQPLAQPFVDHGAEQVFVDLLVVLHNHWPSRTSESYQQEDPEGPNYAYASNLVSFEPIIVEVLNPDRNLLNPDRSLLMSALANGAAVLDGLTVNEKPAATVLRNAGNFLLKPLDGLTTRTGAAITRPDTKGDEVVVTALAPWHLLAGSVTSVLDAIDAGGARGEAFENGLSEAVDIFLRAKPNDEGDWHFSNPRVRGVGLILIDFLDTRLQAHDTAGDRETWLTQELPADIEDLLAGPFVAGASDLVDALDQDPMARKAVEGLLAYALDEGRDPDAFASMVTATIDVLQLVLLAQGEIVPVARGLGAVLDPARGWLDPLLSLARATGQADTQGVLAQTLRNLFTEHEPGRTPIGDIIDGISAVQRVEPRVDLDARYNTPDYQAVLRGIAEFVNDEKRGLRKFIRVIQGRHLPE